MTSSNDFNASTFINLHSDNPKSFYRRSLRSIVSRMS